MENFHWLLLVEDDLEIRETLESLIALEGYKVRSVQNGSEALELLEKCSSNPPHLILLDVMMPVMNGYEFRAEQLNRPAIANIPTVVISADGHIKDKTERLKITEILRKPMDLTALFRILERYCLGESRAAMGFPFDDVESRAV